MQQDTAKKERKRVRKRQWKHNWKRQKTKEQKLCRSHNKKMEHHMAELTKFFHQVRCGLSGHKSAREELEEQTKKEVINFECVGEEDCVL